MKKININIEFEYELIFNPVPRHIVEEFEGKDNGQKLLEDYTKNMQREQLAKVKQEEEEQMQKLKEYFMNNKRFIPSFYKYKINVK